MKHATNPRRGRSRGSKRSMPSKGRNYDGNGGDNKVRGSAQQILDKYLTLARDATSAGDRIAAEGYFQHAEHYYRVLNADDGKNNAPSKRPNDEQKGSERKEIDIPPPPQSENISDDKQSTAEVEIKQSAETQENDVVEEPVKPKPRRGRPKKSAENSDDKSETAA